MVKLAQFINCTWLQPIFISWSKWLVLIRLIDGSSFIWDISSCFGNSFQFSISNSWQRRNQIQVFESMSSPIIQWTFYLFDIVCNFLWYTLRPQALWSFLFCYLNVPFLLFLNLGLAFLFENLVLIILVKYLLICSSIHVLKLL